MAAPNIKTECPGCHTPFHDGYSCEQALAIFYLRNIDKITVHKAGDKIIKNYTGRI